MLTRDGKLFHIDFGHFLGHFKKKFGIEREKAPFVFTPQYAHVLGGPGSERYRLFEEICARAYNIVRRHSDLFINLFSMMLSVGLVELKSIEDVLWLRKTLNVEMGEEEAAAHFKKLIEVSLKTKTTQLMDVVHILANK
jgi:phosphatidylinositol kinase/protein kinase (PI-3  family)